MRTYRASFVRQRHRLPASGSFATDLWVSLLVLPALCSEQRHDPRASIIALGADGQPRRPACRASVPATTLQEARSHTHERVHAAMDRTTCREGASLAAPWVCAGSVPAHGAWGRRAPPCGLRAAAHGDAFTPEGCLTSHPNNFFALFW